MAKNEALHKAKDAKKDEFYTQRGDIDAELAHYAEFFEGKTVFCNCDDPYESNFFKYFAANFNYLKLKKLIATCYVQSPIAGNEFEYYIDAKGQFLFVPLDGAKPYKDKQPYCVQITQVDDYNGDGAVDIADVEYLMRNDANVLTVLKGDEKYPAGDFRSAECVELLEQSDVVVTNPPFSLFREYVAQLVEHGKKFLIIGNQNAITYKEIFPLIMDNKMWLGISIHSGDREFRIPESYPLEAATSRVDEQGHKYIRVKGVRWFTNIDHKKRHQPLKLEGTYYDPAKYPKYDNYDAIEVSKTADIPEDYFGAMGVPITFMDKYSPDQFEILGLTTGRKEFSEVSYPTVRYVNAIQHNPNGTTANGSKANTRATIRNDSPKGIYYTADNCDYKLEIMYARILIRRKQASE